ncbi:MAG TPA: Fe-S cluster assembly protein SufD [Candidatus Limosilactobacillus faecipullorum]|nr:Fe-S cluster assembly protein SufD [Candidatus Limosilactobacillus faecipullorum]
MDKDLARNQLQTASGAHGESAEFTARRLAAFDSFAAAKMPRMQKFNFSTWALFDRQPELNWVGAAAPDLAPVEADQIRFVQAGQTTLEAHLPQKLIDQGVILMDLFEALQKVPDLVEANLMRTIVKPEENKLTAYHLAYLNAGAFLYIPKGVKVDTPVEIDLIQDSTQANQPLNSHLLIIADDNSEVSVLQHTTTRGEEVNPASLMVEIDARQGSHVAFSSLDELGDQTVTYFKRRANIGRDAKVEWAVGLMNGGDTVGDMDSELIGVGGEGDSKLIAVTTGDQHVGINNRVTHHGEHTTGNINQRGVLLGASHLVFNGIGEIIHGAHGANAEQQNRVLMMSPECRGDANPILLIDENDVIAGHAASVGPVNPVQMNYLMSRGIPEPQAAHLVIRGFLSSVITAIPEKNVREKLIEILERKLSDGQL